MTEPKSSGKRRLVGNDILPRHAKAAQPVKPKSVPSKKPSVKAQVRATPKPEPVPKNLYRADKASEEQAQSHVQQSFMSVLAIDLLVIVVLGYVSVASSWLIWALLLYLCLVLVFRISSRRLFISAIICLVIVPILALLGRSALLKSFVIITLFFVVMGALRFAYDYLKKRQAVHNS